MLDPESPALVAYRELVAAYINQRGEVFRKLDGVSGAFEACRAIVENATPEEIEARDVAAPKPGSTASNSLPGPTIRIFVSHSSEDATLTRALVKLLRSALNLNPEEIRATSVDGSRLPGGADTDEQLLADLRQAEVAVGIISSASLDSLYVAWELGARWGLGKRMIPVMARGVSPSF